MDVNSLAEKHKCPPVYLFLELCQEPGQVDKGDQGAQLAPLKYY